MATAEPPQPWEQVDLLSLMAAPAGEAAEAPESDEAVVAEAASEPVPTAEVNAIAAPQPIADPAPRVEPLPIREASPAAPGQPSPQRLLILDTETTGLDPQRDRCIELGAVLFDLPRRSVLSQVSLLLPCDQNAAQAVNEIDPELTQQPQPWQQGLQWFEALLASADLVVAHNAAFDRQWFGIEPLPAIHKPWLCTMEDIRWPADRNLRSNPSVRDLALAYSVPVWAAHRALTDCIYLAQVFERCDDLEQLVQQGLEPRRLYRARLSYEERHRAREAGFRWNEPVSGAWSRRLSEREAALLPFPVVPVDGDQQRRSA
ncbi:MAG: 3'-5' exonuclease [Vulcanococcus sp.]|jgi:DNA polymerase-3 subunit epsilon|uniref:3'-5' exonuclease n=1 Tax=Vulcanococcus sp. TaxID=2856995 RepID=UPI0025E8D067|nr:3'-5' exonuclease [Vulcanococcus sp.]MBW0173427.1 3'-5' exonuclease [Vulcanococcus sp.]MBW0182212.1 3'-5' exonuclease [Vulcanococcus sp.]